jgi:hypothetical protein
MATTERRSEECRPDSRRNIVFSRGSLTVWLLGQFLHDQPWSPSDAIQQSKPQLSLPIFAHTNLCDLAIQIFFSLFLATNEVN